MDRENLIEQIEKRNSPQTDEASLDEFDDSEDDSNEHEALPPEPKEMNPLEERQATLEKIYESHDLQEAKERVAEARLKEADLEEAEEKLEEAEWAKEEKEADEEAERDDNALDPDDPARDVLDRLTEDGIDTSKVDLDKVEIRALGSSGDPMDYRTYLGAAKKVIERQKAVETNPSLGHFFDNEDERLGIEENRRREIDSEIYEGDLEKGFNETKVSEVQPKAFDDWLAEEYPEIAQFPALRAEAAQELDKLLAAGKPNTMAVQQEACDIIETRMAIADQRVARGDQSL